jgi:hypothetical protein
MAWSLLEVAGGAGSDWIVLGGFPGYTQSIPDDAQLVQGISRSHFFFRLLHDAQALTGQLQHGEGTKRRDLPHDSEARFLGPGFKHF